MDEIENLLDSMRIAIQNEKFYRSGNNLAMQKRIKSLEEKINRLLMDNERLMEVGIHPKLGSWTARFDLCSNLFSLGPVLEFWYRRRPAKPVSGWWIP